MEENLFSNFSRKNEDTELPELDLAKLQVFFVEGVLSLAYQIHCCPLTDGREDIDWASAKKTSIFTRFKKIQCVTHLVKINNAGKFTGCYSKISSSNCRSWQSHWVLRLSIWAVGTHHYLSVRPGKSATVLFPVNIKWETSGESQLQNRLEAFVLRAPETLGFVT